MKDYFPKWHNKLVFLHLSSGWIVSHRFRANYLRMGQLTDDGLYGYISHWFLHRLHFEERMDICVQGDPELFLKEIGEDGT